MEPRRVRTYEFVARPYEAVRDALQGDALGIFQRATVAAARRTDELVTTLRMDVGPVELGADVRVRVHGLSEKKVGESTTAALSVSWEAVRNVLLFPSMTAELRVHQLTDGESQLDFDGRYFPPFGALGTVIDAAAGHRIVEATVHRFLREVATRLEAELPPPQVTLRQ